jgi:MSHA biogenesis protein MshQ
VPDHFALTKSTVTPFSNGFTYMGQPALTLGYVLQARNGSDAVTSNYSQALTYPVASPSLVAKDNAVANAGCDLASRLNTVASPNWSGGVYNYNYDVSATNVLSNASTFSRPSKIGALSTANCAGSVAGATGPFDTLDIGITLNDTDAGAVITQPAAFNMNASTSSDCVAAGNCNAYRMGTTRMLYGRVKLNNMYGSERLALSVPIDVQYWQGSAFVRNTSDSATLFSVPASSSLAANATPLGTPGLYFYGTSTGNKLGSGNTTASVKTGTAVAGVNALNFTAPGSSNPGWLDVILSTPTYLQGDWGNCLGQSAAATTFANYPCARAVFGIYKSPLIYRRENY